MLTDSFKRKIDYLRISVTDRCDLRCTYCMAEDVTFLPRQEVLSIEEIIKLIDVFNELGVKKFRLTGGEPLVRKNIISVIEHLFELKKQNKILEHTLTTNGTNLEKYSPLLKKNGINRINVSLDSLNPEKYKEITKWGKLEKVINGIHSAINEGIKVKINTVITKDFNDEEEKEKFEEFFSIYLDCPEVETLGGFMLKEIGHLPKVGEKIQVDYLEMIVTSADQRKIKKITVRRVD